MTGIGLVNATRTTEIAHDRFTCSSGIAVGAVVFSGVAGAAGRTAIGDVSRRVGLWTTARHFRPSIPACSPRPRLWPSAWATSTISAIPPACASTCPPCH
ncbi:hypothetical protein LTS72_07175 [Mycobacterium ostraviense]|nr:hypothetical protein [Mycobacterium ostraviense]UGT93093.1 hypothetical protein LTS72_07175 [Mycobacterium ostraviense]